MPAAPSALEVFAEEGGLSVRTQRSYWHRRCHNLKILATFSAVGVDVAYGESSQDIVLRVRPYIGFHVYD